MNMEESAFDPEHIRTLANKLSREGKLAFALSCSERLYPNYLAFASQSGWGQPQVIRHSLDFGWRVLEGVPVDIDELVRLRRIVREAAPETGDFDSMLVSPALDAASVAELLLNIIEADNADDVVQIAALCRDTVDMYVQELENMSPAAPDIEERILKHPLMQQELRRQNNDINELSALSSSPELIATFAERWRWPARSNIGIESGI